MYFCSLLLGKRILLDFLGFCVGTFPIFGHCCRRFPMLSHFVFVNRFLFYGHIVVVKLGYWLVILFMCTKWAVLLDLS